MSASTGGPEWTARVDEVAAGIRQRVLEHVLRQGEGYLSQACSSAEILAMLYTRAMRLSLPERPLRPGPFIGVPGTRNPSYTTGGVFNGRGGPELDRLIVSPAHYALPLYATLIEVGRLAPDGLEEFNRDGSTMEMIGAEHSPGFEATTGSLAQGLSQAAGIALARKLRRDTGRVWVLMSDGEFEEGQTWEAIATASFHRLEGLRVVVDANGQQCDGLVSSVTTIEPLGERIRSFGASVDEVDGHDLLALDGALARSTGRMHVVIARTDPTRGMPLLAERAPLLHTLRLASDEDRARYRAAYEALTR